MAEPAPAGSPGQARPRSPSKVRRLAENWHSAPIIEDDAPPPHPLLSEDHLENVKKRPEPPKPGPTTPPRGDPRDQPRLELAPEGLPGRRGPVGPLQEPGEVPVQHGRARAAHPRPPRRRASSWKTRAKASRARCSIDSVAFSPLPPRAAISATESPSTYLSSRASR